MTNTGGKFGFRPKGGQLSLEMSLEINLDLVRNDKLLKMAEVVPFIMLLNYSTDAIIFNKSERDIYCHHFRLTHTH